MLEQVIAQAKLDATTFEIEKIRFKLQAAANWEIHLTKNIETAQREARQEKKIAGICGGYCFRKN